MDNRRLKLWVVAALAVVFAFANQVAYAGEIPSYEDYVNSGDLIYGPVSEVAYYGKAYEGQDALMNEIPAPLDSVISQYGVTGDMISQTPQILVDHIGNYSLDNFPHNWDPPTAQIWLTETPASATLDPLAGEIRNYDVNIIENTATLNSHTPEPEVYNFEPKIYIKEQPATAAVVMHQLIVKEERHTDPIAGEIPSYEDYVNSGDLIYGPVSEVTYYGKAYETQDALMNEIPAQLDSTLYGLGAVNTQTDTSFPNMPDTPVLERISSYEEYLNSGDYKYAPVAESAYQERAVHDQLLQEGWITSIDTGSQYHSNDPGNVALSVQVPYTQPGIDLNNVTFDGDGDTYDPTIATGIDIPAPPATYGEYGEIVWPGYATLDGGVYDPMEGYQDPGVTHDVNIQDQLLEDFLGGPPTPAHISPSADASKGGLIEGVLGLAGDVLGGAADLAWNGAIAPTGKLLLGESGTDNRGLIGGVANWAGRTIEPTAEVLFGTDDPANKGLVGGAADLTWNAGGAALGAAGGIYDNVVAPAAGHALGATHYVGKHVYGAGEEIVGGFYDAGKDHVYKPFVEPVAEVVVGEDGLADTAWNGVIAPAGEKIIGAGDWALEQTWNGATEAGDRLIGAGDILIHGR